VFIGHLCFIQLFLAQNPGHDLFFAFNHGGRSYQSWGKGYQRGRKLTRKGVEHIKEEVGFTKAELEAARQGVKSTNTEQRQTEARNMLANEREITFKFISENTGSFPLLLRSGLAQC